MLFLKFRKSIIEPNLIKEIKGKEKEIEIEN